MSKTKSAYPPPSLTITSGEFIFTDKMVQLAIMNPAICEAHKGMSAEIVRRYNAHDALVEIAHVMAKMDCLCTVAETPCAEPCPVFDAKAALKLAGEVA